MTAYSRRYHSRVGRRRAGRRGVTPADCPTASSPASDNLPSRAGRTCRRCRRTFVAPPRGHKVTHWTDRQTQGHCFMSQNIRGATTRPHGNSLDRQTDRHRDIALCHRTFVAPPRGHKVTHWTDRQTQGHCFMSQKIRGATTRPHGDSLDRQTDTGTLLWNFFTLHDAAMTRLDLPEVADAV